MTTRAFRYFSLGMWAAALLGLLGPTGCGTDESSSSNTGNGSNGDDIFSAAPRSGSRIEVRGALLDEVVGSELRLYDTELDVHCMFMTFASGDTYCVPQRFVETFFTDDTCAEDSAIVYVRTTSCDSVEPGDIVYSIVGSSTCADRHRLYRLGDSFEPPAQLYWRNAATGACDLLPVQQSGAFHAVEPASPDSLVSFTERVHDIPGAEVQVYGLEGDDSSFVPLGFYEDGHPCYPVETTEGTRCLPQGAVAAGMGFSDASCTNPAPLAYVSDSVCYELPEYLQLHQDAACPLTERVVRVSGTPVTAYAGESCEEQTTSLAAFTEVEDVPLSSFAPLGLAWVGEGDIQAHVHTSGEVTVGLSLPIGYRIRETGESCWPTAFSDGTVRCVPGKNTAYPGTGHYSDPNCEEELYGGYPFSACGEEPSLEGFVYLEPDPDSCAGATGRVLRLTAYEGLLYWLDSESGECLETDGSTTSDTLFVAEDEIPLEELPTFPLNALR